MNARLSRLFGVGILGGGRAFAAFIGFVAVWQIADRLDPSSLGIWSLALAIQGYALHVSELGLRAAVTAEAGAKPASLSPLMWRYLILRLRSTLVISTLMVTATWLLRPDDLLLMALMASTLFAIALHLDWVPLVLDRAIEAAAYLTIRPLVFCIVLFLVPGIESPLGVALAFAIAWWVAAACTWRTARPVDDAAAPVSDGQMVRLGLPLMAGTIINQLQLSLDLVVVGITVGTAAAGYYYLAAAIAGAGLVFANAASQLAMARSRQLRDGNQPLDRAIWPELGWALLIALSMAFAMALFGPWLLSVAFSPDYARSSELLLWLLPWFMLQSLSVTLQGMLAAVRGQAIITRGNIALVAILVIGLPLAARIGALEAFALLRAVAEAGRFTVLLAMASGQRPSWRPGRHRPRAALTSDKRLPSPP